MNKMKAVGLGVGVATLAVIGLACGNGGTSPPQAEDQSTVGPSGEPAEDPSPVTGGGTPRASFTYEGAVYFFSLGGEAAKFNEDDFELVGSTTESNMLAPGDSLDVYMLKGDTDHVYTFEPGRSFVNEDGRTITIEDEWARWSASNENTPVSSGMMIPRPNSIEELVAQSRIIVLGTIRSVLDEIRFGAYGEDGKPTSGGEEPGTPYTDYEVRIESVLKDDGDVEDGGTLVLRMFGHLSQQSDVVTLAPVQLPQPGTHYLLALGQNPDGTYGSGSEGLIYVDGETVAYTDGVAFSTELTGQEFVEAVRRKAN